MTDVDPEAASPVDARIEDGFDAERPLALGYIRAHLSRTDAELDELRDRIVAFARGRGYVVGSVFVEQVNAVPAAFNALFDAVWRQNARAVVVPSLHHLALRDSPDAMKADLEERTGAEVLVAAPPTPPAQAEPLAGQPTVSAGAPGGTHAGGTDTHP